ncbi:MAG: cbb3-type cytochrome oxidase maturation protein [Phycisphaerales bacterium]|jgi:cbb3-type cytochrome oxidase maturation protein
MSVIWLMIPVTLCLAGLAVWAFVRAVRDGQLDDLDTPPIRAVFDDEATEPEPKPEPKPSSEPSSEPSPGA